MLKLASKLVVRLGCFLRELFASEGFTGTFAALFPIRSHLLIKMMNYWSATERVARIRTYDLLGSESGFQHGVDILATCGGTTHLFEICHFSPTQAERASASKAFSIDANWMESHLAPP
jgi:hypothetical protein